MTPITYAHATRDDIEVTFELFVEASTELRRARGQDFRTPSEDRRRRALEFRRHALAHDPEGFWVARDGNEMVGFGIASLRQSVWYLAALHVRPNYQGLGIGQNLLRLCLKTAPNNVVRVTISEAIQPISNALYARHGMYQRVPLLYLTGRPILTAKTGLNPVPMSANDRHGTLLDSIDEATLGFLRPVDHQYWLAQSGTIARLYWRYDELVGYSYATGDGTLGPAAALSPSDLADCVSDMLVEMSAVGHSVVTIPVPGHSEAVISRLLSYGFRYEPDMNVVLTSEAFGHWDRYLPPGSDALL